LFRAFNDYGFGECLENKELDVLSDQVDWLMNL